jgi:hypothetical protein
MATNWNAPAIVAKVRRGALKGVMRAIGIVETRAVQLVTQGSKTGKVYRRRGKKHQSSAPGEPFASDTGDTIKRRNITLNAAKIRATLHFHSVNAARLEHGTRKMRPRPFARRALSETATQVQDAVLSDIIAELRT